MDIFGVDWRQVLLPDTPLGEIFVRGTLVYLVLFTMVRLALKGHARPVRISDLLVIVLIADAAQNAMAGSYDSVSDGLFLVATIIFWSYALDWLGYRFPLIERLVHPPPLPLVRNGQLIRQNMRSELITSDELMSMLRQQGVDDLSTIKEAYIEGDGQLSVITNNEREPRPPKQDTTGIS